MSYLEREPQTDGPDKTAGPAGSAGGGGSPAETPPDGLTTYCATHHSVETRLRCGKCGTPICPKCLVFTPVGARCRTCADLRPLPQFQVGPEHYGRALAIGLAAAIAGGLAWAIFARVIPFINLWLVVGMGYLAGEAVSRAANRKRGRGLQLIAAASVLLGFAIRSVILLLMSLPPDVVDSALTIDVVMQQFGRLLANPIGLLIFALGIYIAATRL